MHLSLTEKYSGMPNKILSGWMTKDVIYISFTLRGCLKLKNGDVREFVDHIHYGDEL